MSVVSQMHMDGPKVALPRKAFYNSLYASKHLASCSPLRPSYSRDTDSHSRCRRDEHAYCGNSLTDGSAVVSSPSNNRVSNTTPFRELPNYFDKEMNYDLGMAQYCDYLNLMFADDLSEKLKLDEPTAEQETHTAPEQQRLESAFEDALGLGSKPAIKDYGKATHPEPGHQSSGKRQEDKEPGSWIVMATDLTK